jgi:glutamate/tyrosine decarboxylase-like PLP-dependent enzyme
MRLVLRRVASTPPLDSPRPAGDLSAECGETITPEGIGADRALGLWSDVLAPACISADHPRFFAFVPSAPTDAASLFDVALSAANVYAGSWQEGAGAVFAENQVLAWLARCAGLPDGSGGTFVSGGTSGNLSALVAARWRWRTTGPGSRGGVRGAIVASEGAHSSVAQSAAVMDADVFAAPVDERGRLTGEAVRAALERLSPGDRDRVFAVVATGGTTNVGVVDDLAGVGAAARDEGAWFHVDAAYGGAALVSDRLRPAFAGIELADSFIVDPHKWLFAPFDSCALVYRDPATARAAHTQNAEYLDALHERGEWNPSDYAHHLTRRARGLPLWFSLAVHGTRAYAEAVEDNVRVAHAAARLVDAAAHLELVMEPELSVVVFRRVGWSKADLAAWSDRVLADGLAFVVPTSWKNEPVLRLCIVNPTTTLDDVAVVLESLR